MRRGLAGGRDGGRRAAEGGKGDAGGRDARRGSEKRQECMHKRTSVAILIDEFVVGGCGRGCVEGTAGSDRQDKDERSNGGWRGYYLLDVDGVSFTRKNKLRAARDETLGWNGLGWMGLDKAKAKRSTGFFWLWPWMGGTSLPILGLPRIGFGSLEFVGGSRSPSERKAPVGGGRGPLGSGRRGSKHLREDRAKALSTHSPSLLHPAITAICVRGVNHSLDFPQVDWLYGFIGLWSRDTWKQHRHKSLCIFAWLVPLLRLLVSNGDLH